MIRVIALCFVVLFASCKTKKNDDSASLKPLLNAASVLEFLSKKDASAYLVEGEINNYYDYLSISHMAIQTKNQKKYASREEALEAYKATTTSQTLDFSTSDKAFLSTVFDSAFVLLKQVNPELIPRKIKMIKVDNEHYGESVYYTRGESIVVPANIFDPANLSQQLPVMLHEIFHLLSRYEKPLREDLYNLIGFYPHGYKLVLDPNIKNRLLVNPDGVSMDYAIKLAHAGEGPTVESIPLIRSTQKEFNPALPNFFDYLAFDMYNIEGDGDQGYVRTNDDGSSKMDKGNFQDFFTQIKDNTQYIIHPDEIMADNFMHAIIANASGDYSKYSSEGKMLLENVTKNLKEFKR